MGNLIDPKEPSVLVAAVILKMATPWPVRRINLDERARLPGMYYIVPPFKQMRKAPRSMTRYGQQYRVMLQVPPSQNLDFEVTTALPSPIWPPLHVVVKDMNLYNQEADRIGLEALPVNGCLQRLNYNTPSLPSYNTTIQ